MRKYINISDVLWFQEGPGVRNTQYTTDGVKLLNVANLINGNVDTTNTNRYISKEEAYGKYKHFLADEGDLVIASSGIKVEYFDKKMGFIRKEQLPLCMNTSTIRFKVTDEKRLSIRYFMYYLKSNHFKEQLGQQITGSAQLNFGPSHLKKMVFPLIEMEEQAKIIDKLDTIYDIEYKMRTELKLYDQLASSLFIEMFGNLGEDIFGAGLKLLKDVCQINPKKDNYIANIKDFLVSFVPMSAVSESGEIDTTIIKCYDEVKKGFTSFIEDDVLFAKITPCMENGKGAIAKKLKNSVGFGSTEFHVLRPLKDKSNSAWIYYLTSFSHFRKEAEIKMTGSAGQRRVPASFLENYKIALPPLELQNKFAAVVAQIDKSKYSSFLHLSA